MSNWTWEWTILIAFGPVILFLIIPLTITYFVNKKEFKEAQVKRQIDGINQAIPFVNPLEAKSQALSGTRWIIFGYGAYFVIVVPTLVSMFGRIHYGPNLPYLVLLLATGIPWLACFVQSVLLSEKQRLRLQASKFSEPTSVFYNRIMMAPLILLILIMVALKISNYVLH